MRPIKDILFTESEHDLILIQPNFLMRILEEEQNEIVRAYWKSMNNQEPLGDMPNEVNHGLFSLAASAMHAGLNVDVLDFQAYDMYLRKTEHRMILEEDIRKSLESKRAKVFGISTITVSSNNALKIAGIIRETNPDAIIVFGGMHPTMFAENFVKEKEVDFILLGEGNSTLIEIVKNYPDMERMAKIHGLIYEKSGKIVVTKKLSVKDNDLDELPYPAYDLVCEESLPLLPRFFSSKGCPFNCAFCSCDAFYRKSYDDYKIVFRDPIKVVDEIEYTYRKFGMEFYCFGDLTFIVK